MTILAWLKAFFIPDGHFDGLGYLQKVPGDVKEKAEEVVSEAVSEAAEVVVDTLDTVSEKLEDIKEQIEQKAGINESSD